MLDCNNINVQRSGFRAGVRSVFQQRPLDFFPRRDFQVSGGGGYANNAVQGVFLAKKKSGRELSEVTKTCYNFNFDTLPVVKSREKGHRETVAASLCARNPKRFTVAPPASPAEPCTGVSSQRSFVVYPALIFYWFLGGMRLQLGNTTTTDCLDELAPSK